jgi:hypothetical protein
MLQIDDKIISLDILEKNFVCHLEKCKGYCCVHGASGAPFGEGEVELMKKEYPKIKPFLSEEGNAAIEKQGLAIIDSDGDEVTPLINGKECAYAIFEKGIAKCGIEKAYFAGKTSFRKPVSCHLYPIRVKHFSGFYALNYDQWDLCEPARKNGDEKKVTILEFVEQALVRKFGENFHKELRIAQKELKEKRNQDLNQVEDWDFIPEP